MWTLEQQFGVASDFRASWFTEAGLGLFVCWDHASAQGIELGWPLVGKSIVHGRTEAEDTVTAEQYLSSAPGFHPDSWNAAVVAQQAVRLGARYAVFTTRHHGGYSMFDTALSDFSIVKGPFGRDVTRELFDALRERGIRIGVYYSLSDWHHPDYPAFTDQDRPYPDEHWPEAGMPEYAGSRVATDRFRRSSPEQWDRYLDYMHGQVRELLTNYGTIDLLWFDGEWERSPEEWRVDSLNAMIRSLQPDIIVNDRLPGFGDYATPEQGLPATATSGPFELCQTIGDFWGWRPEDPRRKSPTELIVQLAEVRVRGGNYLLNTGIRGDGSLDPAQVPILDEVGRWVARHREAIAGVRPVVDIQWPGFAAVRDNTLYLYLAHHPRSTAVVRGVPIGRVADVRRVGDGARLPWSTSIDVHSLHHEERDRLGELRFDGGQPVDPHVDVIAVEFLS